MWDATVSDGGLGLPAGNTEFNLAVIRLYRLLNDLDESVSLTILVDRGPRMTESTMQNYRMFYDIICRKDIPAVLILTGMEGQSSDRWEESMDGIQGAVMEIKGQASINVANQMNDKDLTNLREMLKHHLPRPWRAEAEDSPDLLIDFWNYLSPIIRWETIDTPLTKTLKECRKVTPKEALRLQRYARLDKEIQAFKRKEGFRNEGKARVTDRCTNDLRL